jgi:hypothetical protein
MVGLAGGGAGAGAGGGGGGGAFLWHPVAATKTNAENNVSDFLPFVMIRVILLKFDCYFFLAPRLRSGF